MSIDPDADATILVINPGSTSTKVALFAASGRPHEPLRELRSDIQSVEESSTRLAGILEFLGDAAAVACVAARGGMVRPLAAGTYLVNDSMIADLTSCKYGDHPSNLGAPLARAVAERYNCPAIIADPVGVDELRPEARLSGLAGIERKSFSHALNLRASARKTAAAIGKEFEKARFVGVHLGGGISVAAIDAGRIVDVNNSNEGGPFTPQRTGTLPVLQLVDLCFSGTFVSADELKNHITRKGGLTSYLGTDSVEEILGRIKAGDDQAQRVMQGMVYQIGKEIGGMAAALGGSLDAVFLTGGFGREPVAGWIRGYVEWIAPVLVFPGEGEMVALAEAAVRYLSGYEKALRY